MPVLTCASREIIILRVYHMIFVVCRIGNGVFRTIILFDQVLVKKVIIMNVGEGQRDELFREERLEKKRWDKLGKNGDKMCSVVHRGWKEYIDYGS